MRKLSLTEQEDLLLGCHILGTGGGGRLERGLALVRANAAVGRTLDFVTLDEVPDDGIVATPYNVGSLTASGKKKQSDLTPSDMDDLEPARAFAVLQEFMGEQFFGVLSSELGGGNTAVALVTASMLGLPLVDGDPSGRSVPEVFHTTFYVYGVGIAPMAIVTPYGDEVVVRKVADDFRAEAVARYIAISSGSSAGVTDHPVRGRVLKRTVIRGAISKALAIGQAVSAARREGKDAVEAARRAGGGFHLFAGRVSKDAEWAEAAGFTVGSVEIAGAGPHAGRKMRIEFKNENMSATIDDTLVATIPDLICVLRASDAEPISNPAIPAGLEVSVVGFPAPAEWRLPRGLESFGPPYLGLLTPYSPIEERFGQK